jgi:hypothetical protein
MRKSPTIECILALRPLHVVVADYPARKMLKTIHYFDVSSWGKNEQGQNYFFVRTEEGAVSIFEFTDRTLADYLLNSYINWSLGKPIDSHLCQEFNDILTFLVEKNE